MNILSNFFESSCENVYGKCNTNEACEDQLVAIIDMKEKRIVTGNIIHNNTCEIRPEIDSSIFSDSKTIVIVLESPHKKEYYNKKSIGPARGTTGKNINNHIVDILKQSKLEEVLYKLYLVEAVSYQCSNGEDPIDKDKRDLVFKEVWKNGGKEDFISRMNDLQPDVIINSCTGGINMINSGDRLNKLVDNELKNLCKDNIKCFDTAHPSSYWFWKKGIDR
ncbi:hypothetical protein [Acholeplasma laidlawii]|uniref:hypothetical protein n=1 Tax=Acholeplasma laidlawii TaxID=2148 RepID=UPI0021F7DFD4|nr:hypothetical protein [Acholeplasma laidlawii]